MTSNSNTSVYNYTASTLLLHSFTACEVNNTSGYVCTGQNAQCSGTARKTVLEESLPVTIFC